MNNKLEELKTIFEDAISNDVFINLDTGDAYNVAIDAAWNAEIATDTANAAWEVTNTAIDAAKEAINEAREKSKGH